MAVDRLSGGFPLLSSRPIKIVNNAGDSTPAVCARYPCLAGSFDSSWSD